MGRRRCERRPPGSSIATKSRRGWSNVRALRPHIRAIADRLADELFGDGSPADLVQRYARILPLSVICELLGLPPADRPKFIAWANSMAHLTNAFGFLRLIGGLFKMRRYLQGR